MRAREGTFRLQRLGLHPARLWRHSGCACAWRTCRARRRSLRRHAQFRRALTMGRHRWPERDDDAGSLMDDSRTARVEPSSPASGRAPHVHELATPPISDSVTGTTPEMRRPQSGGECLMRRWSPALQSPARSAAARGCCGSGLQSGRISPHVFHVKPWSRTCAAELLAEVCHPSPSKGRSVRQGWLRRWGMSARAAR